MWFTTLLTSIGKATCLCLKSRPQVAPSSCIRPSSTWKPLSAGAVAKMLRADETDTTHTQKKAVGTSGLSISKPCEGKSNDAPSVAQTFHLEEPTDLGSACGLGGVQSTDSNNPARQMVDQTKRRIEIRGPVHGDRVALPKVDRSLAVRELANGWFWQYAGDGYGTAVSEREAFTEALLHIGVETKVSPLTRDDELEFVLAQSIANLQVKK